MNQSPILTPIITDMYMAYISMRIGKSLPPFWIDPVGKEKMVCRWEAKPFAKHLILVCEMENVARSVELEIPAWSPSEPSKLAACMQQLCIFHDALNGICQSPVNTIWVEPAVEQMMEQLPLVEDIGTDYEKLDEYF